MGVEDRDWYWDERRRKERLHYNPKSFRRSSSDPLDGPPHWRPGFGTVVAIVLVVALVVAPVVGRWLGERFV